MTTVTPSELYYRMSGRASIGAIMAIVVLPCAVVGVAAFAYGMLVHLSPIIYINLLGTVGVGLLGGWLVTKIGIKTHVRRYSIYMTAAALCSVISIYASWVGWIFALSDWSVIILNPATLVAVADEISIEGVWSIGRSSETPVNGIFLQLVWAAEACMLIGVPLYAAHKITDQAYCETTGRWLTEEKSFGPFHTLDDEAAWRSQMEDNDFGVLSTLAPLTGELANGSTFTTLTMRHAGTPESTHLLSVDRVTMTIDKEGKVTLAKKPILRHMLIDRETHDMIDAIVGELAPPEEVAAEVQEDGENQAGA